MTTWAQRMNVPIDAYPNLKAFRDRMAARPKVQEAMKAEGLIQ
jgi:glutathione S-transferase